MTSGDLANGSSIAEPSLETLDYASDVCILFHKPNPSTESSLRSNIAGPILQPLFQIQCSVGSLLYRSDENIDALVYCGLKCKNGFCGELGGYLEP